MRYRRRRRYSRRRRRYGRRNRRFGRSYYRSRIGRRM